MRSRFLGALVAILLAGGAVLLAQGVRIMNGSTTTLLTVDANGNGRMSPGASVRPTYVASVGGQATTAAYVLSIEAGSSTGFKLSRVCLGFSNATAAAAVTVTIARRTTASSGGTALTAEGTGTTAISKFDPADAAFPGIARLGGTPGTAGAVLGQFGFTVGELGAGTADVPSPAIWCRDFGVNGEKMPTVAAGVANGLTINVSAPGAGGLAAGSIDATVIAE